MDDPVLSAAQHLFNEIGDQYEGAIPIQGIMIVVGMSDDGVKWISHFRSGDLRTWEARGLVSDLQDTLAAGEVARMFEDEG